MVFHANQLKQTRREMSKNCIAKKPAVESIEKIENMVKLIRYDYDRAKRRREKIYINDIFINSLIAHTRDLINNGYAPPKRGRYPALYEMEDNLPE